MCEGNLQYWELIFFCVSVKLRILLTLQPAGRNFRCETTEASSGNFCNWKYNCKLAASSFFTIDAMQC